MTTDDLFSRCHKCLETIMRMLRDCEEVKDFWSSLINSNKLSRIFSIGFHNWIDWNLSYTEIGIHQRSWYVVFGVAANDIWKDRNSMIFSQTSILRRELLFQTLSQSNFILHQRKPSNTTSTVSSSNVVEVCWVPPPDGCFKINVDGSHICNSGSLACGGLTRDSNGNFVRGFYGRVGSCNVVWAEL